MAIEKENILDGDKKGSNQPDSPLPKKKNLVLRGWIVVLTFLVLAVVPYVILSKFTHPYPNLINSISREVSEILIKHGMDVKQDRECPWFYWSARPGDYAIHFYRADEIPQAAKLDTIRFCMDLYEQRGRKERFKINMYHETLDDKNRWFSGVKPFFEMTIGGNN